MTEVLDEIVPRSAHLLGRLTAFALIATAPAFTTDYSTYIGDSYVYDVKAMTTDSVGNTYLAGGREITSPSSSSGILYDVFVTKLDVSGKLIFTITISGKGSDLANAIALDPSGNIYVAGSTSSADFPLNKAFQTQPSLGGSGFVVKLSPDGGTLLYSTYFGGTLGLSVVNALATDAKGNLYLTGYTIASGFPQTPGMPAGFASNTGLPFFSSAFVAEISAAGDRILYSGLITGRSVSCGAGSSCFLSTRSTAGVGIAVDVSGNAYIAGNSNTTDLPVTPGAFLRQGIGAFVAKVNAGGTGFGYLTYIGSANYVFQPYSKPGNSLRGIAVDSAGNAYLAGATSDPQFPATRGTVQQSFGGGKSISPLIGPPTDAFVAKLNPGRSAVEWATFLGGTESDSARALAVDASGNVWVGGATGSANFPNANGWSNSGDFLIGLNPSGSTLLYSSRFPAGFVLQSVALDPSGLVHIAGATGVISTISPAQPPAATVFGITNAAGGAVSGRIVPGELISIHGPHIGPVTPVTASVDNGGFLPTALGGVSVAIGGKAAPLLSVSDARIDAVVPSSSLGPADVIITIGTSTSSAFRASVVRSAPEIFRNPDGSAAALNEDGSVNSRTNPAGPGSIISIWATGVGGSLFPFADGQIAASASSTCLSCLIVFNNQPATILYAGTSPGLVVGVTQINFKLPERLFSSVYYFALNAEGNTSIAWLYVAQ